MLEKPTEIQICMSHLAECDDPKPFKFFMLTTETNMFRINLIRSQHVKQIKQERFLNTKKRLNSYLE